MNRKLLIVTICLLLINAALGIRSLLIDALPAKASASFQKATEAKLRALTTEEYILLNQSTRWLVGIDLSNTDLSKAYLFSAHLERANLEGAQLEGANLQEAELRDADLSGADLGGANLINAHLDRANLSGAALNSAVLFDADLIGANLEGANLRKANLAGAGLELTNLKGADLEEAYLEGYVERSWPDDSGRAKARLERASYDASTRWPPGFDPQAAGAILVE